MLTWLFALETICWLVLELTESNHLCCFLYIFRYVLQSSTCRVGHITSTTYIFLATIIFGTYFSFFTFASHDIRNSFTYCFKFSDYSSDILPKSTDKTIVLLKFARRHRWTYKLTNALDPASSRAYIAN